jgi:hypothetical protein
LLGHAVAPGLGARNLRLFFVASDNGIIATIGGVAGDANPEQALAVVQQLTGKTYREKLKG